MTRKMRTILLFAVVYMTVVFATGLLVYGCGGPSCPDQQTKDVAASYIGNYGDSGVVASGGGSADIRALAFKYSYLPAIKGKYDFSGELRFVCMMSYEYIQSHKECDTSTTADGFKIEQDGTYAVRYYSGGGWSTQIVDCKPLIEDIDARRNRQNYRTAPC